MYNEEKNLGNLAESQRIKLMLSEVDRLNIKNRNILDMGCYDGIFLASIKNRNNNFFGLEASDYEVKKCQEKGIDAGQFFFNDLDRLPYDDNFFDLVIAGEIIEHIFDTDFFLEEIKRILKPGGKLLISTPNMASFGRRLLLLFGFNPVIEVSPNEAKSSGHIRYFTFQTLKNLLRKHNLRVIFQGSDYVNFSKNGEIKSNFLAKIFPKLGTSIIVLVEKK